MRLTFSHYVIRGYLESDLEGLHAILSDPDLMKEMDHTYTPEETAEFLVRYGLSDPPYVFALEDMETKKLAGHIIFHPYDDDSWEAGWVIHPAYRGRGLAQRCTQELIREGMRNGIRRFIMECTSANAASRHVIEKCGFEYLGTGEDGLLVFRKDL